MREIPGGGLADHCLQCGKAIRCHCNRDPQMEGTPPEPCERCGGWREIEGEFVGDDEDAPPAFENVTEFRAQIFIVQPGQDDKKAKWCPLIFEPDNGIVERRGALVNKSDMAVLWREAERRAMSAAESWAPGTPWRVLLKLEQRVASGVGGKSAEAAGPVRFSMPCAERPDAVATLADLTADVGAELPSKFPHGINYPFRASAGDCPRTKRWRILLWLFGEMMREYVGEMVDFLRPNGGADITNAETKIAGHSFACCYVPESAPTMLEYIAMEAHERARMRHFWADPIGEARVRRWMRNYAREGNPGQVAAFFVPDNGPADCFPFCNEPKGVARLSMPDQEGDLPLVFRLKKCELTLEAQKGNPDYPYWRVSIRREKTTSHKCGNFYSYGKLWQARRIYGLLKAALIASKMVRPNPAQDDDFFYFEGERMCHILHYEFDPADRRGLIGRRAYPQRKLPDWHTDWEIPERFLRNVLRLAYAIFRERAKFPEDCPDNTLVWALDSARRQFKIGNYWRKDAVVDYCIRQLAGEGRGMSDDMNALLADQMSTMTHARPYDLRFRALRWHCKASEEIARGLERLAANVPDGYKASEYGLCPRERLPVNCRGIVEELKNLRDEWGELAYDFSGSKIEAKTIAARRNIAFARREYGEGMAKLWTAEAAAEGLRLSMPERDEVWGADIDAMQRAYNPPPPKKTFPCLGCSTPWGEADEVIEVAPGIVEVGTPGHGGIWLSAARAKRIPGAGIPEPKGGAWFEEDLDYNIAIALHPAPFSKRDRGRGSSDGGAKATREAALRRLELFYGDDKRGEYAEYRVWLKAFRRALTGSSTPPAGGPRPVHFSMPEEPQSGGRVLIAHVRVGELLAGWEPIGALTPMTKKVDKAKWFDLGTAKTIKRCLAHAGEEVKFFRTVEEWKAARRTAIRTGRLSMPEPWKNYFVFSAANGGLPIGRLVATPKQASDETAVAGRFGLDACDILENTDGVVLRNTRIARERGVDWDEFALFEYDMTREPSGEGIVYCVRHGEHVGEPYYRACAPNDEERAMWLTEQEMLDSMNRAIEEEKTEEPQGERRFDEADRDSVMEQIKREAARRDYRRGTGRLSMPEASPEQIKAARIEALADIFFRRADFIQRGNELKFVLPVPLGVENTAGVSFLHPGHIWRKIWRFYDFTEGRAQLDEKHRRFCEELAGEYWEQEPAVAEAFLRDNIANREDEADADARRKTDEALKKFGLIPMDGGAPRLSMPEPPEEYPPYTAFIPEIRPRPVPGSVRQPGWIKLPKRECCGKMSSGERLDLLRAAEDAAYGKAAAQGIGTEWRVIEETKKRVASGTIQPRPRFTFPEKQGEQTMQAIDENKLPCEGCGGDAYASWTNKLSAVNETRTLCDDCRDKWHEEPGVALRENVVTHELRRNERAEAAESEPEAPRLSMPEIRPGQPPYHLPDRLLFIIFAADFVLADAKNAKDAAFVARHSRGGDKPVLCRIEPRQLLCERWHEGMAWAKAETKKIAEKHAKQNMKNGGRILPRPEFRFIHIRGAGAVKDGQYPDVSAVRAEVEEETTAELLRIYYEIVPLAHHDQNAEAHGRALDRRGVRPDPRPEGHRT